ncbi:hypothetical protein AKJ16_DCAP14577, partial [Drosera capensis]
ASAESESNGRCSDLERAFLLVLKLINFEENQAKAESWKGCEVKGRKQILSSVLVVVPVTGYGDEAAESGKFRRMDFHDFCAAALSVHQLEAWQKKWNRFNEGVLCSRDLNVGIVGGIAVNMASMILKWLLPLSTPMTKAVQDSPPLQEANRMKEAILMVQGLEGMYTLAQKCMQLKPVSHLHCLLRLMIGTLGENTESCWLHEERHNLGGVSIEVIDRIVPSSAAGSLKVSEPGHDRINSNHQSMGSLKSSS